MTKLALRNNLKAQLVHWKLAIERLGKMEDIASVEGWLSLERRVGSLLRTTLLKAVHKVSTDAETLSDQFDHQSLDVVINSLQRLRRDYLRVETTLDFFADAINTRTSKHVNNLLSAADLLAERSMHRLLNQLGYASPPVVCYIDKGLGASILKADLRLWDRNSINPVAMIKVVRHNILRPTSLLHEAGHQVAHIVGWNEQLARALSNELPNEHGAIWGSWSSEIAADAFAFTNAGFASVAALRNVVDGGARVVFRYLPGDPHPIAYLRVLLGIEMCRQEYGAGPWDELESVWNHQYPLQSAPADIREMLHNTSKLIPEISRIVLRNSYVAFGKRSLSQLVDPSLVSPRSLAQLECNAGSQLYSSPYIVNRESLRLLALSGYQFATQPERGEEVMQNQLNSMLLLGSMSIAA